MNQNKVFRDRGEGMREMAREGLCRAPGSDVRRLAHGRSHAPHARAGRVQRNPNGVFPYIHQRDLR